MSANETYELAVRLRGEGIEETEGELEGVENSFDDTAESVGDSADEMEGFAQKWEGAMGAVVGGLAVASAGLLSQVPVIGGLMESLFSIIEAVAFQMDKVLRPILQPIADGFFQLSGAIFDAEGPLGTIIGIVGTLIGIFFAVIVPIAQLIAWFTGFANAGAVLVAAGKAIVGAIGAIAAALGLPVAAVVALIAAIVALVAIFVTDFMGIRTAVVNVLGDIVTAILNFRERWNDFWRGLGESAYEFGVDLMQNLAEGISSAVTAPINAAQDAMDGIKDEISFDQRDNDRMAQQWGRDMVSHFAVGMSQGARTEISQSMISAEDSDGGGLERQRDTRVNVSIEGRDVDKETRRFSDRQLSRRGRYS